MLFRNPCASVRRSAKEVTAAAQHVTINEQRINALAADINANHEVYMKDCAWNTEWHYHDNADLVTT